MNISDVDLIVIHCSATRETQDFTVQDIRQMHLNRGFNDIGYHFYITKNGIVHKGRPLTKQGAHVKGHNKNSIGICYEGGLDIDGIPYDTRTDPQREAICELLSEIYPQCKRGARICGHRDLSPDLDGDGKVESHEWMKMCPCFNAEEEYYYYD